MFRFKESRSYVMFMWYLLRCVWCTAVYHSVHLVLSFKEHPCVTCSVFLLLFLVFLSDFSPTFKMPESTICSLLKQKAADVTKVVTLTYKEITEVTKQNVVIDNFIVCIAFILTFLSYYLLPLIRAFCCVL